MYPVKHVKFTVSDSLENISKILNHPNVLIKGFGTQELWSNYEMYSDEYRNCLNKVTVFIDCYLKVKHSRRLREAEMIWDLTAADVLLIVK